MGLTVRDILKLKPLNESKVVAGHDKIDNVITGVTIIEHSDIVNWLVGGELLFTSLYPIETDPSAQSDLIKKLTQKGVSALAIKVHRFVDNIPQAIISAANEFGLPIIELEGSIRFTEAMYPVMAELFNKQLKRLNYFKEVHSCFTALALEGEGLEGIAMTLEKLVGNPVAIFDKNFNYILSTNQNINNFTGSAASSSKESINERLSYYRQLVTFPDLDNQEISLIIVPIQAVNQLQAHLAVVEINKQLQEEDFIALEHAATVVCLEMVKRFAVSEVEQKFKNDLILDLITGHYDDISIIHERANLIGWDLHKPYVVMLFHLDNINEYLLMNQHKINNILLQNVKVEISSLISHIIGSYTSGHIMGTTSDSIVVLWPATADEKKLPHIITKAGHKAQSHIKNKLKKISAAVGIGDVAVTIDDISRSYREAQDAIIFGKMIYGKEFVAGFSDLGVLRLLCKFHDRSSLADFLPKSLKSLIQYDKDNNSNLLETLEVFLTCNSNASKASKALFIHYKTMLYRLERIKSISDIDWEKWEDKIEIELGLKILHLLEGMGIYP